MRKTVLILGLALGFIMFIQAFIVYGLFSAAGDENNASAAAAGLLVVILWVLACAFVIPLPLVSTFAFVLAGLLAVLVGGQSDYTDMWFWGSVGLFLALLSFFGWHGKVKDRREKARETAAQAERDARYEALLTNKESQNAGVPCHSCGNMNPAGTRYCGNCGSALLANQSGTA